MVHFLFQPDPIDDVKSRSIRIGIHLNVLRIESRLGIMIQYTDYYNTIKKNLFNKLGERYERVIHSFTNNNGNLSE